MSTLFLTDGSWRGGGSASSFSHPAPFSREMVRRLRRQAHPIRPAAATPSKARLPGSGAAVLTKTWLENVMSSTPIHSSFVLPVVLSGSGAELVVM